MTTKKQHFVPRFYLKNFTDTPKRIGVHNFKNEKTVKSSNLYNQCQKDFFYDKDNVIEDNLAKLEREVANLLRRIIEEEHLSVLTNYELFNILFFVILQNSRTEVSSDKVSQLGEVFIDKIVGEHKLKIEKGHIIAMRNSFMLTYIASDLKLALLVNNTQIPFITSDHPVSLTNPLFDRINKKALGGVGYAKKGLVITFPISSKLCLVYYDYNSYFLGRGRREIIIEDANNIKSINRMSASSCNENFYFDPELSDELINDIVSSSKWKNNKKHNVTSVEYTEKLLDDTIHSRLLSRSIPDYREFSLSGIMKINKKGLIFIKHSKIKPNIINTKEGVRDLNWVNLIKNFYDEVNRGWYKETELYKYIEKNKLPYS